MVVRASMQSTHSGLLRLWELWHLHSFIASRAEVLASRQAVAQAIQLLLKVSEGCNEVLWAFHATQAIFPCSKGRHKNHLLGLSLREQRFQLRGC